MKLKPLVITAITLFCSPLFAETEATEAPTAEAVEASAIDIGYFYGYTFGDRLSRSGTTDLDLDAAMQGLKDALDGKEPNLTADQQRQVIGTVSARQKALALKAQSDQEQAATQNQAAGAAYLAENATKSGVKTTASGLQYRAITKGKGATPTVDSSVKVHYKGRLLNGYEFDSSYKRDQPAVFGVTQVIAGWTEGLQLMKIGGKMEFTIPADLAYGAGGSRNIPPMSVLVFEVELLEVN